MISPLSALVTSISVWFHISGRRSIPLDCPSQHHRRRNYVWSQLLISVGISHHQTLSAAVWRRLSAGFWANIPYPGLCLWKFPGQTWPRAKKGWSHLLVRIGARPTTKYQIGTSSPGMLAAEAYANSYRHLSYCYQVKIILRVLSSQACHTW